MHLVDAARDLARAVDGLAFSESVAYVYNPLDYAWDPHEQYVRKFGGDGRRSVLLVGMNPGPWGMGQTGVPFGDVRIVREWLGVTGVVRAPERLHPKRPVHGFACTRKEASGSRLWGWAQDRFGAPEKFFASFFVTNYCPLLFFTEDGKNLTPPQLRKADEERVYAACDAHLLAVMERLEPRFAIGIGRFAEERVRAVVDRAGLDVRTGTVLHPSPASPQANKGWAPQAEAQLRALGAL